MRRHELTDKQWNRIKDLLPPERKVQEGRPANRTMIHGILYWLNTGVAWRDLPERFGPWQSVYTRYRRWTKQGVWEKVLTALIEADIVDDTTLMLDSTSIKVHQHAGSSSKKRILKCVIMAPAQVIVLRLISGRVYRFGGKQATV